MAVRKICRQKGCRASPRCEHPWWFDVMHGGKRWRMRVDDFAVARGATEPVTPKQTAEHVWEPKFLGEIMAGRDPRVPPTTKPAAVGLTVSEFVDCYYVSYVEAEALRNRATIKGRLNAVKATLGTLPVAALERSSEILRFKAAYRRGHDIATVNRALSTLRAAINWGRFQDPPVLPPRPSIGSASASRRRRKRNAIAATAHTLAILVYPSHVEGWLFYHDPVPPPTTPIIGRTWCGVSDNARPI